MLRQYGPQRHRIENGRAVGTVPVGTIIYIQDDRAYRERYASLVRRNPWIIEAWLTREYSRYSGRGQKWDFSYMARGGHLAVVRDLRSGRRIVVADWLLLAAMDCDLDWWLNEARVARKLAAAKERARMVAAARGAALWADRDWDDLPSLEQCDGILASCGFDEEAIDHFHALVG